MRYIVKTPDNKYYPLILTGGFRPDLGEGLEIVGLAEDFPELAAQMQATKAQEDQAIYIEDKYLEAKAFGESIMKEFATENIVMGITQDGMTSVVRKAMTEVILALTTASLYDAIAEAKAIPADKKDAKYITDARLLQFINKIETYLQLPLSTSL